jgi:putative holliday junction resolvase
MTEKGVWLGIDFGSVRIGVARSDPGGVLASPLATVPRARRGTGDDLRAIAGLVADCAASGVVVGLPQTLRGERGAAAQAAERFAAELAERVQPVRVELSDERFTTVTAARKLAERGVRAKASRAMIDAAAAVEILQGWLDGHRCRNPETG